MNETPVTPLPEEPKKNNTTIIIAVVVVVLLCCCCIAVIGGYWLWNNGDQMLGNAMKLVATLA
jgi:hypothetical protein